MIENHIKTILLLGALTGILLWVGSLWGQQGLIFAIIFVVIMNFGSYFYSDKLVLAMYRAKPVSEHQEPALYKIVKRVAEKAEMPMPKVCIIPSESPNAMATGRNPKNAVVACTKGIMELLDEKELEGVIAHEISHIKNRDILIATIAATIAGVISFVAMMARWGALFGGFGGRGKDGGRGVELIVLAILTPIIAMIIQLAISRSREYLADASAAKTLNDSSGLASALRKLSSNVKHNPMRLGNKTTASLFIVNPFSAKGLMGLFSTHPPMDERVKKLEAIEV